MELAKKKCVPCEGGVKPLSGKILMDYLEKYGEELDGWDLIEGKKIVRDFKFDNFTSALKFVNSVGKIADKENHHPDICFGWGRARFEIMTHAIGGLSENDFILAAKINSLS